MRLLLLLVIIFNFLNVIAQNGIQQIVRGNVLDKFNKQAIKDVTIIIKGDKDFIAYSNVEGNFEATLPIGRYNILVQHINYQTQAFNNLYVSSAKQLVLNLELDLLVATSLKAVTIKGSKPKAKALNEMSLVSARQFSVEEANRYAGSLGDPARMAQNFAGVLSNGDRRNDIIVRGNSPLGISWRLQDIEIPNPNHFSGIGNTGGAISILNNNNLSNSDFLTGAFAPQYGNALAGVFDLQLRNGNNQTSEYMAQFGMNGLEFGAEGPISKKNKSSFIVNARYSTLEIFDALKINLGANAQAKYRDITFKLNFPTKKIGTFAFWGIAGLNTTVSYSKNYDSTGKKLNPRPKGFDTYFDNSMSAIGVNHTYNINKNTNSKLVLAFTFNGNETHVDSLFENETKKFNWLDRVYKETRVNLLYQLNKRWSSKNQTQLGAYITNINFNIKDSLYFGPVFKYLKILTFNGSTFLNRFFVQHQYKPTNKLTLIGGMHTMHFSLNNSNAIEPRFALKYQIAKKISLYTGVGLHHQLQPFTTYFYNRTGLGSIKDSFTNKNLDFIKSKHFIVGADYMPFANYRAKVEAYYQNISGAAVESTPSSYSVLNEGAYYYTIPKPYSTNAGKGYNYGLELTLEKFFSNQFYFLSTNSVYNSRYKGSDNIWRSSAFNSSWTSAWLAGYEFKATKYNLLNINLKLSALGGRRYSPVDEVNSKLIGETRFIEAKAYSLRFPTYFRPDIKLSYKINRKKTAHIIALNIDNFINKQNIQNIEYDKVRDNVGYSYQTGLFPVVQYKLDF